MLIDSAFQTTLEIFHKIFQNFFKRLTYTVNRTVGCSDRTIRKVKIFKNWQTAWTVQKDRIGRKVGTVRTDWTAQAVRIVRTAVYDLDWNLQNSRDSVLFFRFLGYLSPFGYRQIRYNTFCSFIQIKSVPNSLLDRMNIFNSLDYFIYIITTKSYTIFRTFTASIQKSDIYDGKNTFFFLSLLIRNHLIQFWNFLTH